MKPDIFEPIIDPKVALATLELAISRVHPSYLYAWDASDDDSDPIRAQTERCFTYELYHQWRNILEYLYGDTLKLNCEITKNITRAFILKSENTIQDQVCNELKLNTDKMFPDFVLHGGQDDTKNQILACEVKRKLSYDYKAIANDILKLCEYLKFSPKINTGEANTDAGFMQSVFILTDCDMKGLIDTIKYISKKGYLDLEALNGKYNLSNIQCKAIEIIKDSESKPVKLRLHSASLSDINQTLKNYNN